MKPLIKELRLAVLGHVEWVSFVRVPALPRSGDIQHASDLFEQAAGGGAVVAAQMARLAGGARFYTALGRDPLGERCAAELKALGLTLHIAWRDAPTRRAITFIEPGASARSPSSASGSAPAPVTICPGSSSSVATVCSRPLATSKRCDGPVGRGCWRPHRGWGCP
ncbi:PfkB family carbohydrate kinase [Cyanobium sp. ATX-6F1]|uniref:PfkB family carbohydrate kinase n=1 Tax=Cyanobium sp. ATX-6F1 TaxID=3137388 RepID=UPI0039BEA1DF